MTRQPRSLRALLFLGKLGLGDKNQFLKKTQEKNPRTEGNATVLYAISVNFTRFFTTASCSLQLTRRILTFCMSRDLKTNNFAACDAALQMIFSVRLLHVDHY